jgi:hypothetical protein
MYWVRIAPEFLIQIFVSRYRELCAPLVVLHKGTQSLRPYRSCARGLREGNMMDKSLSEHRSRKVHWGWSRPRSCPEL